ncbi:MAG: MerR family transcriptional regulator [Christensenellales bacterium]|jgi:DNA-binding transcriptional MerR regulator
MRWLTIGQMAKLNQISEQTLRLYDKEGLLLPVNRGEDNRYRYYDIKQCAVLDMIRRMKSLGMKLKDIKNYLNNMDVKYFENFLRHKQDQIDEQIKALKAQRRAVERTLESHESYRNAPPDGTIVLEYIGKRQMYCVDTHKNFYDQHIEVYEEILRELRNRLIEDELPHIYFCNAGTILRKENLIIGRFYSTEVFVFVDCEFVSEKLITTVPAGSYLCIYCDDFYKEKDYAQRLLKRVEQEQYIINGDYLCETVAELPVIGKEKRGMFLRLQIPIQFS